MYAVIETGGKQYRVAPGQTIRVETLPAEAGKSIDFKEVLMIANDKDHTFGTPHIKGAKVTGEVVEQGRGKKIEILKFKRRKHHMKRQGHRQNYTAVKITDITGG